MKRRRRRIGVRWLAIWLTMRAYNLALAMFPQKTWKALLRLSCYRTLDGMRFYRDFYHSHGKR